MRSLAFTDDPTLLYDKSQCGLGQYALDEGKIQGRGTRQNAAERKVKGFWTGSGLTGFSCFRASGRKTVQLESCEEQVA